jgi:3D (Asp-Asp-Asp) domain-containing protein
MKTLWVVVLATLGCLCFAANEFADAPESSPNPVHIEWPLPSPLPPSPQARTNYLLQSFGIYDQKAPQLPDGYRYWGTVVAKVTAYEPSVVSCGYFADGKTSTLRNAWKPDGCAVAPDAIPYGTLVWIPGIGWRLADDTGSAMKRSWKKGVYHIDVRMSSVSQCRRWGNQDMVPVMLCLPE